MIEIRKIGELDCTIVNPSRAGSSRKSAVILCHGFGAPGTDLVPIAQEMIRVRPKLENSVFVFPHAPIQLDPHFDSRAWWMIDNEKIQTLMMTGEFRELRNSVPPDLDKRRLQIFAAIDFIQDEFEIPPAAIVVGGFSQGAMLATDVALTYPDPLGGLIVWSGTLMNEHHWKQAAQKKSAIRVVQSHGRQDPILPFAGAEFLRDTLLENGHQVNFVPFNGEHTIGSEAMLAAIELLESVISQ